MTSTIALQGFSPVSYFEKKIAEPGDPRYAATHRGQTYHLASPEQVRAFKADPEKYLPAYDGFCAFGCAIDKKFPVDPRNFKLVDGRLFLFLKNPDIDAREKWNEGDEAEQTRKADAFWETQAKAKG
jgi:YHS domain-containing protein